MAATKRAPTMRPAAATAPREASHAPVVASGFARGNGAMARLFRAAKDDEECPKCAGKLHRKAGGGRDPDEVPPIVYEVLRSPGQPLDDATRTDMEQQFGGADFSGVRVHTDARAAESAEAVNAKAYTVGQNIVFNSGLYSPTTGSGRELFAHELAHVSLHPRVVLPPLEISSPDSRAEAEAAQLGRRVATGTGETASAVHHRVDSAPAVHRAVLGPTKSDECGDTGRPSSWEHMLVEQDYALNVNSNSSLEYGIPGSSATGKKGFADIIDWSTPSVFEVKQLGDNLADAEQQLIRYRRFGSECPGLADLQYGTVYPSPRIIPGATPGSQLLVELTQPGILVYTKQQKQPQEVPVVDAKRQEEKEKQTARLREVLIGAGIAIAVVAAVVAVVVAAPYIAAAIPQIIELLVGAGVSASAGWQLLQRAGFAVAR